MDIELNVSAVNDPQLALAAQCECTSGDRYRVSVVLRCDVPMLPNASRERDSVMPVASAEHHATAVPAPTAASPVLPALSLWHPRSMTRTITVCPFCGGYHEHPLGPLGDDPRRVVVSLDAGCGDLDIVGSAPRGVYWPVDVSMERRQQLLNIAFINPRFAVVDADGVERAGAQKAPAAIRLAQKACERYGRVWIVNRRLEALRDLQPVDESCVRITWPPEANDHQNS